MVLPADQSPTPSLTPGRLLWRRPQTATDAVEVAADLACDSDFVTVAQFYKALRAARRRRALEATRVLAPSEGESFPPLSYPANWRAFVNGARAEALRIGKPAPMLPDKLPPGVSIGEVLRDMFRAPDDKAPAA